MIVKSLRLFGVAVILTAGALPAAAQNVPVAKNSVMKKPDPLSQAEFEAATQVFKSDSAETPGLFYEVRLPKNWVKEKSTGVMDAGKPDILNKNVTSRQVRYVSPAQKHRRSFLTVETQALTYEIGARNWFLNYIEDTGITLETIDPPGEDKDAVEAAYVAVQGDITYGVRIKTIINGPRVVIARYFVPIELYDAEKVLQAQGISSFHLTGKKLSLIEKRITHGFLDQAYFDYPTSWVLTAQKVIAVDRMNARLHTPGLSGRLTGQIDLALTSRFIEDTSLGKEAGNFGKKFTLDGYAIGARIETRKLGVHKDIVEAHTEIYKLVPKKNFMMAYELWVTAMQSEGYIYIISMITPARDAEFYRWARNVKAYEIVVSTSRQVDGAIDNYQFSGEKTP